MGNPLASSFADTLLRLAAQEQCAASKRGHRWAKPRQYRYGSRSDVRIAWYVQCVYCGARVARDTLGELAEAAEW